VALNGAEPVRKETIERFSQVFQPFGFRRSTFCPGYGLAEATLKVTASLAGKPLTYLNVKRDELEQGRIVESVEGDEDAVTFVGCGPPLLDTVVAIVDPVTGVEREPDQIGEIWVSGSGVTKGYWHRENDSQPCFTVRLSNRSLQFLRTGDLGFMNDGELFITGRIKDMIIIAGRNIYPQDLELVAEKSHPAVRSDCCAAFVVEEAGQERLVIAAELDRHFKLRDEGAGPVPSSTSGADEPAARTEWDAGNGSVTYDPAEIVRAIRGALADSHDVQVHRVLLLRMGSIPKTSSGKTKRHACRQACRLTEAVPWKNLSRSAERAESELLYLK
jgi:acyl-CoA synthetase (AMP-forming)/AMP-acid ligase II